MRSTSILFFPLTAYLAQFCFAQVQLRSVSLPTEVPVLTPVPVIIAIENVGPDPLLVPVNYRGSRGWHVSITLNGIERPYLTSGPDYAMESVVWLKPGDHHLVYDDASFRILKEGEYVIQAILESTGNCRLTDSTRNIPKTLFIEDRAGILFYRCWQGVTKSEEQKISVTLPKTQLDRQALSYVEARPFPLTTMKFSDAYGYLKENFPSSIYTFAAAFHRGAPALREMVRLQPGGPLSEYARFVYLSYDVDSDRSVPEGELKALAPHFRRLLTQKLETKAAARQ